MGNSKNQDVLAHAANDDGQDEEADESRFVFCDYCDTELALSDEELAQGWYVCPECGELSHLGKVDDTVSDSSQVPGMGEGPRRPGGDDRRWEVVECGHCGELVSLSARQAKLGWFFCPHCHGVGQLDDFVTCLSCGSDLELSEEEWDQEWYRCPECDQVTLLVELAGEVAPGPAFADLKRKAEWVQLKTAVGPEDASLEVAFLRANDIDAFAWQQGAGRAYGLTVGPLGVTHIMVREDQLQSAHSLMESKVEVDQEEASDDSPSDTSRTVMGAAAIALNPLGTGLAIGASRLLDRHKPDEDAALVECPQCGVALELSDQEVAQGYFSCPECQQLVQLDDYVICPVCQTELVLDEAERRQGWYRCPECRQKTRF